MLKSRFIVLALAGTIMLTSFQAHAVVALAPTANKVPLWFKVVGIGVAVCATGLISSAWAKSIQKNQQLSQSEASTCGFSYFYRRP